MVVLPFQGRIDPDGGWPGGRLRWFSDEALGVQAEGAVQSGLTGGLDSFGLAVMDLIGPHCMFSSLMGAKIDLVAKTLEPVAMSAATKPPAAKAKKPKKTAPAEPAARPVNGDPR